MQNEKQEDLAQKEADEEKYDDQEDAQIPIPITPPTPPPPPPPQRQQDEAAVVEGGAGDDRSNAGLPSSSSSSSSSSSEDSNNSNEDVDDEEDEEEEEEDLEEEDDDDDEEEPKLKYLRLPGTISSSSDLLKKDNVSTMAVSDRFLAIGTHSGFISILDLNGNDVKTFQSHSASINQLSIDTNGEFVASASDDGKVVINSLYTQDVQLYNFKRPVKAVALEPDYSRKATRQFCSGGMAEYLNLGGKGWFGSTNIVIHSGEGPIYNIQWRNNFITWANEAGVKIYDTSTQEKFAFIDRPAGSPRADLFRCNLCWKSDVELLIGWADSVKVCVIKERSKMDIASGLPSRYVEIICQFRPDFIVSGIAPLKDDLIVLLSYMIDVSNELKSVNVMQSGPVKRKKSKPPEIHIVDYEGDEIANDVLSMIGFESYSANDYKLEYCASESTFYIVSPKDIVAAKPRDIDDHIQWLVERRRYEDALKIAEEIESRTASLVPDALLQDTPSSNERVKNIVDIGQKWLATLIVEGRFDEAASNCPKILRNDASLWEKWVFSFAEVKQLKSICPYIPLKSPQLSSTLYEMILAFYLNTSLIEMLKIIRQWPSNIYSVRNVLEAVEDALMVDRANPILMELAMELYLSNKQYDLYLYFGLKLRIPGMIDTISQYNLFQFIGGDDPQVPSAEYPKCLDEKYKKTRIQLVFEYDEFQVERKWKSLVETISERQEMDKSFSSLSSIDADPLVSSILWKVRAATEERGVLLLIENLDRIPLQHMVDHLKKSPHYLHVFLDALFKKDVAEGAEFHRLQIALYAEYDYPRMLDFLRSSTSYPFKNAYEICETRDLVPEMVFLLGKLGDNRRALMLIIERLGDVGRAMEFAKEQNDEELWEDLLKYAMDKPPFIIGMLENLGSFINPVRLIERIPDGLEILGLRNALVKIVNDYGIQMSLREGCERILRNDTIQLFEQLCKTRRRGLIMTSEEKCATCSEFVTYDGSDTSDVAIFFCKHAFHTICISSSLATNSISSSSSSSSLSEQQSGGNNAASASKVQRARINKIINVVYEKRGNGGGKQPTSNEDVRVTNPFELQCPLCTY